MKTLIEIHALQNFAPSNLNRDDTGAPKDALFGGSRRARISSQCLKRAVRQHFHELVEQNGFAESDMGVRTKRVLDKLSAVLEKMGHDKSLAIEKCTLALSAIELSVKEDGKSQYLLYLGNREIDAFAHVINEKWETLGTVEPATEPKKAGKAKKEAAKSADPELKKALERILNGGKAVDVALFGRMLADMPEKNQDAACQVAHAISTHAVNREFDFYTAVNDLKPDDSSGADMMGTVEFNSACFYRYAVVDWDRLVKNLQGDSDLAAKGVRAFLQGFVVAEPTGKQNTFAAHNPPEFVAIAVRHNSAPRNLANAFEIPIRVKKGESLTKESATKLVEKAKILQTAFGGSSDTFVLDLVESSGTDFGTRTETLSGLLDDTMKAVLK